MITDKEIPLILLADENLPFLEKLHIPGVHIAAQPGRSIGSEHFNKADILWLRSVTKIQRGDLEGSPVKMVCTATAGVEHIDTSYLAEKNIAFASAPGSNADSVVDYVLCSIFEAYPAFIEERSEHSVGVVGCGEVGKRLHQRLSALKVKTVLYDPLREKSDNSFISAKWNDLAACSIISLHCSLTGSSFGLINKESLSALDSLKLFINASRGQTMNDLEVLKHFEKYPELALVLDVFPKEPEIHPAWLERCFLATPHIAGYAREAKLRGLRMIADASQKFFAWPQLELEKMKQFVYSEHYNSKNPKNIAQLLKTIYPLRAESENFKQVYKREGVVGFDHMRKNYPFRAEFSQVKMDLSSDAFSEKDLLALGFAL